jgi:hypothetical protein
MPGLPKSFAKLGFKKGWELFKKTKKGSSVKRKKTVSKRKTSSRKRSPAISGVSFPQVVKRTFRRRSTGSKTDKILSGVGEISTDIALLVAGMIGASQIKKISPMKNMFAMNLLTFGIGSVGAVLAKKKYIRIPLMGIAASAFISQVKTSFPKLPISGDEDFVYLPSSVQGDESGQIEYMGDLRGDLRGEVVEGEVVEGDDLEGDDLEGNDDFVYGAVDEDMM